MGASGEQPGPCPCIDTRCHEITFKTFKNGHATTCICPMCRNRKNQRTGAKTEVRRHRRLTAAGAPVDESAFGYPVRISTQDKTGKQIPVLFWQTMDGAWFRRAFKQATDKIPYGSNTLPGVYVERADGRAYIVLDVSGRPWR